MARMSERPAVDARSTEGLTPPNSPIDEQNRRYQWYIVARARIVEGLGEICGRDSHRASTPTSGSRIRRR